jgi:hypothetical protein
LRRSYGHVTRKNRSIPAINGRENYVDSENYRKFTRK